MALSTLHHNTRVRLARGRRTAMLALTDSALGRFVRGAREVPRRSRGRSR